ncbi:MAG TPA: hypothetical protein VFQ67_08705 [Allosphingosinicella sp.]|jgi:hypothetical protein|nr:hypothetical protein [Allosphingosinicella sp.]
MNIPIQMAVALLASSAVAPSSSTGGWELDPAGKMTWGTPGKPSYRLDCTGPELVVTQFGVTKLVDVQRNQPVGDSEGTTLPEGASVMALATDKTEPDMVPASAVRSAGPGWDMTIRLAKDDPAFLSLPRAGMMSLFTTGFTIAVQLGKADRKLLAAFVSQCRGK